MGRMAEARKRARARAAEKTGADAAGPQLGPAPAGAALAPVEAAGGDVASGPEPEGSPAARPEAVEAGVAVAPAADAVPDEPVFADEPPAPSDLAPTPSGGAPVVLPASGLAEDILRQLDGAAAAAAPQPAAREASRDSEAAPGPAEEVLGQTLSFFSAPAQAQRAAAEATEHLASFFLAREEYGVDVRQVQEIRRVAEITSVPRAPEFVRGVINLRGRILPVLDLRRRLGLGEVALERATRIVVVRVKERLLGLLVDGASQVLKVPVSQIEPAPEEVVQKGGDYIRGVAKLADRLIILVDLERLLAHELAGDAQAAARRTPAAATQE